MTGSRDIFTKIGDTKERDKVFYDLAASKSEIVGKVHSESNTYLLRAKFFSQNELECELLVREQTLPKTGEMIMQITLGAEKFLCSSPFHLRSGNVYLKTSVDLFHLQRREDFRLRLPLSYQALFSVNMINSTAFSGLLPIVDLSGGGCKLMNPKNIFAIKQGDIISGELQFPDKPTIQIKGVIRHVRDDEKEKSQYFGVQFSGLAEPSKNRIISLVLNLYRELFSRLSKK